METKYYYAFSNFMNECRNASQQLNLNETQLFETKEQLQENLRLIAGIEKDTSTDGILSKNSIKYKSYVLKRDELGILLKESEEQYQKYEKLQIAGVVSKNELSQCQMEWQNAKLAYEQFKNDTLLNFNNENEKLELEIMRLQSEVESSSYQKNDLEQTFLPLETEKMYQVNQNIENLEKEQRAIKEKAQKSCVGN